MDEIHGLGRIHANFGNWVIIMARKKSKITMGDPFTTRKGKYGCYKYVNGKKVAFVQKRKPRRKTSKTKYFNKRRY